MDQSKISEKESKLFISIIMLKLATPAPPTIDHLHISNFDSKIIHLTGVISP
jgi:hypothetical protein